MELDAATNEEMRMGCHLIVKSLSLPANCSQTVLRCGRASCFELSQGGERGLRGTGTPPCRDLDVSAHASSRRHIKRLLLKPSPGAGTQPIDSSARLACRVRPPSEKIWLWNLFGALQIDSHLAPRDWCEARRPQIVMSYGSTRSIAREAAAELARNAP